MQKSKVFELEIEMDDENCEKFVQKIQHELIGPTHEKLTNLYSDLCFIHSE